MIYKFHQHAHSGQVQNKKTCQNVDYRIATTRTQITGRRRRRRRRNTAISLQHNTRIIFTIKFLKNKKQNSPTSLILISCARIYACAVCIRSSENGKDVAISEPHCRETEVYVPETIRGFG
jgi:hypothetical protein